MGVNTAVHILLDASSSMQGKVMDLASQACFAVATALHGLIPSCNQKGFNVVTSESGGYYAPVHPNS